MPIYDAIEMFMNIDKAALKRASCLVISPSYPQIPLYLYISLFDIIRLFDKLKFKGFRASRLSI